MAVSKEGYIERISGPVVEAHLPGARLYDVVKVGNVKLLGEIIKIVGDTSIIQVYEDTSGLQPQEPVYSTGEPLSLELGPGILQSIYDGIQRPLKVIEEMSGGVFLKRGIEAPALERTKKWDFKATVKKGDKVKCGDILGTVQETDLIEHRILAPIGGKVEAIKSGSFTVEEEVCTLSEEGKKYPVKMYQKWQVRKARPVIEKFPPIIPLVTGQRVIDTFFPIAKGGTACIPGPFGSGKCVAGDTPVLLSDGTFIKMEKLYESVRSTGKLEMQPNEETYSLSKPIGVFSLDGVKLQKTSAPVFYKGMSDSLISIKTRTGRSVKVTPIHKLFRINSEGAIEETPAGKLKAGDFIVGIRKLDSSAWKDQKFDVYSLPEARVVDSSIRIELSDLVLRGTRNGVTFNLSEITLKNISNNSVTPKLSWIREIYGKMNLPLPVPTQLRGKRHGKIVSIPSLMSPDLAEFLGFVISEGYIRGDKTLVFTNNDEVLLGRYSQLVFSLFGVSTLIEKRVGKATNALISSRIIVDFIKSLGIGENARTKQLPSLLFGSSDASIAAFLRAYYLGDGSYYDGQIELTTASEVLSDQLSYVLNRFGLVSSKTLKTVQGWSYHRIWVRGKDNLEKFHATISGDYKKITCIKKYVEQTGSSYSAVDVVPLSPQLIKTLYSTNSAHYSELKGEGIEIHNYISNKEKMSVTVFKKFISMLSQRNGSQIQQYAAVSLAKQLEWIFCDEIVLAEELAGPFDVYDLTVPETQNFVGGHGGLLLHNTVTQQSLAKYSDAQIIVYVGCGERGNEMTDVLTEFPQLIDPKSGKPLMMRTVLIANTSNMPVAAREASVYTGITIAEYFRDMGYDVALMADSTSRWAEAMREIGGRLEEMPGEEGYPAYLARRLAEFYERAGRVRCNGSGERYGSVTVIGAVSPPGGDISEPVSQNTLRVTKVFLALDASLAYKRHFPAINWLKSYTLYAEGLNEWFSQNISSDFQKMSKAAMILLQKEAELQEVVQLVGPDALPEKEQAILVITKMLREDYLQQNAYSDVDARSELKKQYLMLKMIMSFGDLTNNALEGGVQLKKIMELPTRAAIGRMKEIVNLADFDQLHADMAQNFDKIKL